MSNYSETLYSIKERVHGLASDADCMAPDNWDSNAGVHLREEGEASPGARLLISVRDDFVNSIEETLSDADFGPDGDALTELEHFEGDSLHEIADGAPSVYTHERWQQFTDLGAWQQDISDFGEITDLTNAAGIALYEIAKTLLYTLLTEVREAIEADQEESNDEDEDEDLKS